VGQATFIGKAGGSRDATIFSLKGQKWTLTFFSGHARHTLVQGNNGDRALVAQLLPTHQPRAIINFAAVS
jgi:dTDP-D-glucose 4,6-dehydratase